MRKPMCFFAAFTLAAGVAAETDPFVGTWKLDVEKSTYKGVPKPREETVTATDQGDNRILSMTGTAADGSPIKIKVIQPVKGGPIQITGAPPSQSWDALTFKPINLTTQEIIYSKDGKQVGVRHIMLARNHQMYTARYTGTAPQGKTVTEELIWKRQ